MDLIDVPAGLRNVAVTDTTVGDVRGREGFYHYRQYSAIALAQACSLEEVWYLLFFAELPTTAQLADFRATIAPLRAIPEGLRAVLPGLVAAASPQAGALDGLRTALSLFGAARGMAPWLDLDSDARVQDAMSLCAVVPSLLAAVHRLRAGEGIVDPDPALGAAANYLYMMNGEAPDPSTTSAIEHYLISTIDHGFNASTFAARVIAGTGADLAACVVGAIGALSGPLHGGAPSRALDALDEIGSPDRAAGWVTKRVAANELIMGFGHAVYRTEDPRSAMLKGIALKLGGERVASAIETEREIVTTLNKLKPGREINTNVEFYAGIVMERCGVPAAMFTPTFAASRVIGWCVNILEQAGENKIIRPAARYVGPPPPQAVPPISERG